jgi:hypothetical protein
MSKRLRLFCVMLVLCGQISAGPRLASGEHHALPWVLPVDHAFSPMMVLNVYLPRTMHAIFTSATKKIFIPNHETPTTWHEQLIVHHVLGRVVSARRWLKVWSKALIGQQAHYFIERSCGILDRVHRCDFSVVITAPKKPAVMVLSHIYSGSVALVSITDIIKLETTVGMKQQFFKNARRLTHLYRYQPAQRTVGVQQGAYRG